MNSVKNQSCDAGESYFHRAKKSGSHDYISPSILQILGVANNRKVIDIGCGNGWLCRNLVDAGFDVVGIEPSAMGIKHAKSLVPEATLYQMGVYDELGELAENDFDIVICSEVLEHLYSPAAAIDFARKIVKNNGILIVTVPYHGYLKNLLIAATGRWDGHHQPLLEGGHIKFYSRKNLTTLLHSGGFIVQQSMGLGRLPWLWKSMLLMAIKPPVTQNSPMKEH